MDALALNGGNFKIGLYIQIVKSKSVQFRKWQPVDAVDAVLVDIWWKTGDQRIEEDSQQIHANVQAKTVAAWGQEFAFLDWAGGAGYKPPATVGQAQAWRDALGVPWHGVDDPGFPIRSMVAAYQAMLV